MNVILWLIDLYLSLCVAAGGKSTRRPRLIPAHPQLLSGCVSRTVDRGRVVGVINVLSGNKTAALIFIGKM